MCRAATRIIYECRCPNARGSLNCLMATSADSDCGLCDIRGLMRRSPSVGRGTGRLKNRRILKSDPGCATFVDSLIPSNMTGHSAVWGILAGRRRGSYLLNWARATESLVMGKLGPPRGEELDIHRTRSAPRCPARRWCRRRRGAPGRWIVVAPDNHGDRFFQSAGQSP